MPNPRPLRHSRSSKCPRCGGQMFPFSVIRKKPISDPEKFEQILVTALKCRKCGRESPLKEVPISEKNGKPIILQ